VYSTTYWYLWHYNDVPCTLLDQSVCMTAWRHHHEHAVTGRGFVAQSAIKERPVSITLSSWGYKHASNMDLQAESETLSFSQFLIVTVTWLVTHVKVTVIHNNCEESKVRVKLKSLTVSTITIFSFSKCLKEAKREMLEVMNWYKLYKTAGTAWREY